MLHLSWPQYFQNIFEDDLSHKVIWRNVVHSYMTIILVFYIGVESPEYDRKICNARIWLYITVITDKNWRKIVCDRN